MTREIRLHDHPVEDAIVYVADALSVGAKIVGAVASPVWRETKPVLGFYAKQEAAKARQKVSGVIFEAKRKIAPPPKIRFLR